MHSINLFLKRYREHQPLTMVTCYDYTSARIVNATAMDAVLVGDSVAMVMHGYDTTINADLDMMVRHVAAVRRGMPDKFLIADMPFLTHRHSRDKVLNSVDKLMKAGAEAIKIEGARGHAPMIRHIVDSGVPVMGHLGLTPQSVHALGGYKLQGRNLETRQIILNDARVLEEVGCFSLVLEMVPAPLAKEITSILNIPTIGIGAGPDTSGQVLVFQDVLGMNNEFNPKFLRTYLNGFGLIRDALNRFAEDVRNRSFPSDKESFT
ncbi:MAG: 3-methyl-2-oxobutanoate hydroxymethyltransferase [FCB group bacterium]|nr:3-methyl-2-oxobutanoate hydroxymethyltransferase [FCB group bacterium]